MKRINNFLMVALFTTIGSFSIIEGVVVVKGDAAAKADAAIKAYHGTYKNGASGSFEIQVDSSHNFSRKKTSGKGLVWKNATTFAIDIAYKAGKKKSDAKDGKINLLPGKSFTMPEQVWSATVTRTVK